MQYHKYSLTEIENMMPWEREIYLTLLQEYIENEKLKQQQREGVESTLIIFLDHRLVDWLIVPYCNQTPV